MSFPRGGPASRTVALDLMLRTFMNSADFHASNPKIWENIARLVPGTTPQQCFHRWEELRASSHTVVGDISGLTAQGRPISAHSQSQKRQMTKFVRSMLNPRSSQGEAYPDSRPQSVLSNTHPDRPRTLAASTEKESYSRPLTTGERSHAHTGKFVANFCQTMLGGSSGSGSGGRKEGRASPQEPGVERGTTREDTDAKISGVSAAQPRVTRATESRVTMSEHSAVNNGIQYGSTGSVGENGPNMVVHVCDEAKKLKRDFTCPRDILVREMRYFAEYLSSDAQLWDEVDISVHCDVPVFEWLMRYAKRGMLEGACGEKLSEPLPCPTLEPGSTVSILISSDFLKMDKLVEQCLEYVHENISAVVASPCNMGCINDRLMVRLAAKFTPLEVEKITDRKDKIKSKLFIYQLQQLFRPSYSTPSCPASAATLHRCKYCGRLLTMEQRTVLPCIAKRVSVDHSGSIVYSHEGDPSWDVNQHLGSLQREGLSARNIYWRLWGIVNWLVCERCRLPFQCCDLASCPHHPQPATAVGASGATLVSPRYPCCGRLALRFSALPHCQRGCAVRDHTIDISRLATTGSRPNSAHTATRWGDSDPTTHPTATVYSTLLALRDSVCKRSGSQPQGCTDTVAQESTEMSLLRNEETKLRAQSSSGQQLEPQLSGRSEREANAGYSSTAAMNEAIGGHVHPSNSRQLLTQGAAMVTRQRSHDAGTRHQSHDVHKLHDDDDGEEEEADSPPQLPAHPPRPRRNRHSHASVKQRHPRHEHWPPPLTEWVWDSKKSKRWNQDMQRESDERRLTALSTQLSQMCHKQPSLSEGATTKSKEGPYAGGIYSRLETQFRAQQAARTAALQSMQNRSQGSGRRR